MLLLAVPRWGQLPFSYTVLLLVVPHRVSVYSVYAVYVCSYVMLLLLLVPRWGQLPFSYTVLLLLVPPQSLCTVYMPRHIPYVLCLHAATSVTLLLLLLVPR